YSKSRLSFLVDDVRATASICCFLRLLRRTLLALEPSALSISSQCCIPSTELDARSSTGRIKNFRHMAQATKSS
ncbi:Hypothetical predicted protein, partial [Paramuricea clavata]